MRRSVFFLALLVSAAGAPAASAKRDTTRVALAWMSAISGKQDFSWTATAPANPPRCGGDRPDGPTRSVTGSGAFSLPFATPKPERLATVQLLQRAYLSHPQRTLSYRPKGAPPIEDDVKLPVTVTIAGNFTDAILACDAFDASTTVAPATACGAQAATLDLRMSFGVIGATTLNDADLQGQLVKPWFLDQDEKSLCPTYRSIATGYFTGGAGTAACPDNTALDPTFGPPEAGIAKYFTRGKFYPRLTAAHPKAFTLTVDKPIDCTLTPSEGHFPPVAPTGTLHITGGLHYVWTFTPKRVTGPSTQPRPL